MIPDADLSMKVKPIIRSLNEDKTWGAKLKTEYILYENGEKVKLKNGNCKIRKINIVDWN